MKYVLALCTLMFLQHLNGLAQVSFDAYSNLFTTPLSYNIPKTKDSIKIDGVLNEAAWKDAKWSEDFVDIEGDKNPKPPYNTHFKMLWNDKNLYIAAELQEQDIWSYLTEHDDVLYHDNDFEVFIDPDGDTQNYYEIEVNALKNVFDLFLPKPYRNGGGALTNWNTENLKVAVSIDGTLNKPGDKDKKWWVEMAVPFRSIVYGYGRDRIPANGTIWRMNFSRVEWNTEVTGKVYKRKTDSATGQLQPEHNWVWSPQGLINMHYPERWGYVKFLSEKAIASDTSIALSQQEQMKKYLWLVYYKQQDYYQNAKKYAASINDLGFGNTTVNINGKPCVLHVEATTNLFEATILDAGNAGWHIDQNGEIREVPAPAKN